MDMGVEKIVINEITKMIHRYIRECGELVSKANPSRHDLERIAVCKKIIKILLHQDWELSEKELSLYNKGLNCFDTPEEAVTHFVEVAEKAEKTYYKIKKGMTIVLDLSNTTKK